ncbi:MAG: protein-xanthan lyase [Verrucomicrobiales bacterium]|nr:protein-xanthan lyase [Verrucomicrobiales bacterium]
MKKCIVTVAFVALSFLGARAEEIKKDVCVYCATPSGILAAIAAKKKGRSVVIVEPSRWVGGMLGAGLKPLQDCPNYASTGGMTRKLIATLGGDGKLLSNSDSRALNPLTIREDFQKLLDEHGIEVVFEHRVSETEKSDGKIQAATFDLAPFDELGCPPAAPTEVGDLVVSARVFIDASYEGDLMAKAGVSFRVGREAESEYGEELAGVREPMELAPIDPFVEPGNPESGLLDWVENDHGKPIGAADGYTQAYNYRYYTTKDPEYRVPLTPPNEYDPAEFELVGRYVEHLTSSIENKDELRKNLVGIFPGWKNSGEWNYQRDTLFSMSPLGISQKYAAGDYEEKAEVWKEHQDYLRGLHSFMSNDSRVPEWYRKEVEQIGLDGRVHPDTGGWPNQLYIRVSRRLEGRYTITAHDVYNRTEIDDPVGLAQYGIDTYPARRIWIKKDGQIYVGIEGKMFIGGGKGPTNVPYPIPYRAITPKKEECTNLIVPVCFSASHLGYASARMEPVFMICGESAGIAASHAISEECAVQDIKMDDYLTSLQSVGQKLNWDPEVDESSAKSGLNFGRLLSECDMDKNGSVSKEEWDAGKQGWEWLFKKIDENGDGVLNEKEYSSFQTYKKKNSDWLAQLKK